MSIAVIGKGKTGSAVIELLGKRVGKVFDRQHPVTITELKAHAAVIIFVPGEHVAALMPMVQSAGIPAVWGSTGYAWPKTLSAALKAEGIPWVVSANFSLGMQLLRQVLQLTGQELAKLLPYAQLKLHEVHHVEKQDAPSGTALAWQEWLGHPCTITYERMGDVKGQHELQLKTKTEVISFSHEALDRAVFAQGAIWAADYLLQHPALKGGVYSFADLIDHSRNQDGRTSP